jgi:peptidoglycan/LPS O-acetylase OafA/YrhL
MSLVVFSHYTGGVFVFGIRNFYWVSIGGFGVTLFIVLSGMCLEHNYGGHRYRYAEFIRRRLRRVYPSYWLSLAASIILGVTMPPTNAISFFMNVTAFEVFEAKPWADLLFGVSWFVGLIVSLYLVYPLLSKAMRARPKSTILLSLLVSSISRGLVGNYWAVARPTDWFPPCRLLEFALGVWLVSNKKTIGLLTNLCIGRGKNVITYFSNLSYPIYLVHLTVLGFINSHNVAIGNPQLSPFAFIIGTFILSNIVFYAESIACKQLYKAYSALGT